MTQTHRVANAQDIKMNNEKHIALSVALAKPYEHKS